MRTVGDREQVPPLPTLSSLQRRELAADLCKPTTDIKIFRIFKNQHYASF